MSCHEIMSKLSAYIDGETRDQDAGSIREHTAGCTSCSSKLMQLQNTAKILGAVPDVEPPAFLIEQIRSATVNRKPEPSGILERLSAALTASRFAQVAAGAVATAAVAFTLISSAPDANQQIAEKPAITQNIVAADPQITEVKPVEVASPVVNKSKATVVKDIKAGRSVKVEKRASYKYARNRISSKRQAQTASKNIKSAGSVGAKNIASADVKRVVASDPQVKPAASVDSVMVNQPMVAPVKTDSTVPVAVAELPKPVESTVKVTRMLSDEHESRLGEEVSAQQEMRDKLAARNMQRRYTNNYLEHLDGKTISVEIASMRF